MTDDDIRQSGISAKREIITGNKEMKRVVPLKVNQGYMKPVVNNDLRFVCTGGAIDIKPGDDLLLQGVNYVGTEEVRTGDWALVHVTYVVEAGAIVAEGSSPFQGMRRGLTGLSIKCITHGIYDNWQQFKTIKDHLVEV
jgi:hypothetical protein